MKKFTTLASGAERRQVYYFTCTGCGKRRETVQKKNADKRSCRKCRANKVNENQLPLIESNYAN